MDSEKGEVELATLFKVIGLVTVVVLLFLITAEFFLPWIQDLFNAFRFQPEGSKAVNSARGLALAVSCTSIMMSHPSPSATDTNVYLDEWNTPLAQQDFGSQIPYSCEDTVPEPKETRGEMGVWFRPPRVNGVNVVCDTYNKTGLTYGAGTLAPDQGCSIRNFALPQQVRPADIGLVGQFPVIGNDLANFVKNSIQFFAQPRYVLYYQQVPSRAKANWMKRMDGVSASAIAFGIGVELAAAAIPGGGGDSVVSSFKNSATKVGKWLKRGNTGKFYRYIADSRTVHRLSGYADDASERYNTYKAYARDKIPDDVLEAAGRSRDAATTAAGYSRRFGEGALAVMRHPVALPAKKLGYYGKWVTMRPINFVGRKLPLGGSQTIMRHILSNRATDDLVEEIATTYSRKMARDVASKRLDEMIIDPTGRIQNPYGKFASKTEWREAYEETAEQNMREAIDETADTLRKEGKLPESVTGDDLVRYFDEGGDLSIEEFAEREANTLILSRSAANDFVKQADSGRMPNGYDSISPRESMEFALRFKTKSDTMAGKFLKGDAGFKERLVKKYGKRMHRWYMDGEEAMKGALRGTNFERLITGGAIAKKAARYPDYQGGLKRFVCSNPAVQDRLMQELMSTMEDVDTPAGDTYMEAFSEMGQCGVISPTAQSVTFGQFCGASPTTTASFGSGMPATSPAQLCAAASFWGYSMSQKMSVTQMSGRGRANMLYLDYALGPRLPVPLHPIANWYFVGLQRRGNPNSRFFMAAPMYTDSIARKESRLERILDDAADMGSFLPFISASDSGYEAEPRLEVRFNTMEQKLTSDKFATAEEYGPDYKSCQSHYGRFVDSVASGFEGFAKNAFGGIGFLSPFHDASQLYNAYPECSYDQDGDGYDEEVISDNQKVKRSEAKFCGFKGTFLDASTSCNDELGYIKKMLVQRKPGPGYPRAPPSTASSKAAPPLNPAQVQLWNVTKDEWGETNWNNQTSILVASQERHVQESGSDTDGDGSTSGGWNGKSVRLPPVSVCSEVRFAYCTTRRSPWADHSSCGTVTFSSDLGDYNHKDLSTGDQIMTAGIDCTLESGSLPEFDTTTSIQPMKAIGAGPVYPDALPPTDDEQLWYWVDRGNDGDCNPADPDDPPAGFDGNCAFNWGGNAYEPPKTTEVTAGTGYADPGAPAMKDMYPTIMYDAYGVTQYTDSTSVMDAWSAFSSFVTAQRHARTVKMRSVVVRTKGFPDGKWITKDTRYAEKGNLAYGFSDDISKHATRSAALLGIATAAGFVPGVGDVVEFVIGSAEVIYRQVATVKDSWPVH